MSEATSVGEPIFLTLDEVLQIHAHQIEMYGGDDGLRDIGLLESAIAMPRQMFSGNYLHEDVAAMAAAYLFHIVSNHAFVDGNKRTGAHAAVVFLGLNGIQLDYAPDAVAFILEVASGTKKKDDVIAFFRNLLSEDDADASI